MDTLNTPSSIFSNFPPDIWACIAHYLPIESLGVLKLCGSKYMWRLLATKNTVKAIIMNLDNFPWKSWPSFLNELPSFEELSITCLPTTWTPRLNMIPCTLRKLEVRENASFFDGPDKQPLLLVDHVPQLEVLYTQLRWCDRYPWMRHIPASLTKLSCGRWRGEFPLPPSLIHLTLSSFYLAKKNTLPFPSGLISLKIDDIGNLAALVPLLPPSILSFEETVCYHKSTLTASEFKQFPTNLTKLRVQIGLPTGCDLSIFPHLTDLLIWELPNNGWKHLPTTLTRLELPFRNTHYIDFELSSHSSSSTSSHPPPLNMPSLTYLKLQQAQLSVEASAQLPSSLTRLHLSHLDPDACEHLPRGITELNVSYAIVSPEFIGFLPPSLTYLKMSTPHKDSDWFDRNTSSFLKFPEYEQLLASNPIRPYRRWKGAPAPPPSLTSLNLRRFADTEDVVAHESLTRLYSVLLDHSANLTNEVIPRFSRYLKILRLPCSSKITSACFVDLPPRLIKLNLRFSSEIFDSDIQHLPRTLEYVSLANGIHLTNACIADLPQSLKKISLAYNEKITTSVFMDLPPGLRVRGSDAPFSVKLWRVSNGKIVFVNLTKA